MCERIRFVVKRVRQLTAEVERAPIASGDRYQLQPFYHAASTVTAQALYAGWCE